MSKTRVTILIVVFFAMAFWGSIKHSFDRGSGWLGGSVDYSYNYGEAYNWESGYDSLRGILKGRFPEIKCGSVYLDTFERKTMPPSESNKYISGDHCKTFMSLSEFVDRYSNKITVGELRTKKEMPNEETQVTMFNEWKTQGLLDDIRYKDVTVYEWSNIWNFA